MRARYFHLLISVLLASSAALADAPQPTLTGLPHRIVHPSKGQTLYDQMAGDRGTGINSQNFEAEYDAYDDEAADDFVVPEGARWKVTEVDMAGYYNEGPADSMNVTFYKDKRGRPGKIIKQFVVVPPNNDGDGSFPLDLGGSVTLKPGRYWLSIQANQVFSEAGDWSWASSDEAMGSPAMWRNPGGGFDLGCTDWTVETDCIADGQGDHLFALKGKSR